MSEEMEMEKEVTTDVMVQETPGTDVLAGDINTSPQAFAHAQRVAKMYSVSSLCPKAYQGKVADCLIAGEYARRMNVPTMFILQNTTVIQGKPALSGSACIALIKQRSEYKDFRFKYTGKEGTDDRTCLACATNPITGELESASVSIADAKKWGWYGKPNSHWPKMPDQALAYRAAAFFARKYCPEVTLGLPMIDEVVDTIDVTPRSSINEKLNGNPKA